MAEESEKQERDRDVYRAEQFWVTAAVVGFNGFVYEKLSGGILAMLVSVFISVLGMHIVLTRSMHHARMAPEKKGKLDTW